jgi:hypothetical protein
MISCFLFPERFRLLSFLRTLVVGEATVLSSSIEQFVMTSFDLCSTSSAWLWSRLIVYFPVYDFGRFRTREGDDCLSTVRVCYSDPVRDISVLNIADDS